MTDLSDAYRNAAHIPGGDGYPARWKDAAATFRAGVSTGQGIAAQYDQRYDATGARSFFDWFRPADTAARGLLVFLHGGYWSAFDRRDFSHLAAGALARGWAVALLSYDLCPSVRIAAITAQVARGIERIAAFTDLGPLVITGHSAGGHLAARMACADVALRVPLRRVVPISPLANLAPLMRTDLNATLHIDAPEAAAESPLLHPRPETPVHVWVGSDERPAFLDQARWLAQGWTSPLTTAPGRHHFDVIDDLARSDSPLMDTLLA